MISSPVSSPDRMDSLKSGDILTDMDVAAIQLMLERCANPYCEKCREDEFDYRLPE